MKNYYFMNKPEVMEKEEYEIPGNKVTFYYNRNKRLADKEERENRYTPSLFSFSRIRGKRRGRLFYLVDIVLVVALLIFYFLYNRSDKPSGTVIDGVDHYVRSIYLRQSQELEVSIYLMNKSEKAIQFNKEYDIKIYFLTDKKVIYADQLFSTIHKKLHPKTPLRLDTKRVRLPNTQSIQGIQIKINNDITIKRYIKLDPS